MLHAGGACFEFEGIIGQTPVLRDLNGRCSVTNAAESVVFVTLERVRVLNQSGAGTRMRPRAIVYRDSTGIYDALRVEHGEFVDFIVLNATTLPEAFEELAGRLGVPVSRLLMSAGEAQETGT